MSQAGISSVHQRRGAADLDGYRLPLHLHVQIQSGWRVYHQPYVLLFQVGKSGRNNRDNVRRRRKLQKLINALIVGLGVT